MLAPAPARAAVALRCCFCSSHLCLAQFLLHPHCTCLHVMPFFLCWLPCVRARLRLGSWRARRPPRACPCPPPPSVQGRMASTAYGVGPLYLDGGGQAAVVIKPEQVRDVLHDVHPAFAHSAAVPRYRPAAARARTRASQSSEAGYWLRDPTLVVPGARRVPVSATLHTPCLSPARGKALRAVRFNVDDGWVPTDLHSPRVLGMCWSQGYPYVRLRVYDYVWRHEWLTGRMYLARLLAQVVKPLTLVTDLVEKFVKAPSKAEHDEVLAELRKHWVLHLCERRCGCPWHLQFGVPMDNVHLKLAARFRRECVGEKKSTPADGPANPDNLYKVLKRRTGRPVPP